MTELVVEDETVHRRRVGDALLNCLNAAIVAVGEEHLVEEFVGISTHLPHQEHGTSMLL